MRGRNPFAPSRTATATRFVLGALITIAFLFPVYWLFIMAVKTPEEVFASPPVWVPTELSLENFRVLFRDGDVRAIMNSTIAAGASTALAMFFGTIAAYSIARYRTGGDHLAIWIISHRMIPPIAIVFPLFLALSFLRLNDTFLALIGLYTAFNLPYVIWMMRGYVEDVPVELEESALVDGLTRWQTLFKVVFPMLRTGLFATAVFTFIFAWNEFIFALIISRTDVVTFPVQVSHYFGPQQIFWAKIGAMSLLGTLPVFFVIAISQKLLVRGMSMGAVKG